MDKPLTASQLQVVEALYEPGSTLKVIAGPGSGKTLALLHRIRRLITTKQVRPDEILVLSLTNKAVDNILTKLLELFHSVKCEEHTNEHLTTIVNQINVSTIHGLASRIVTENEGTISVIEENGWRGLMRLVSKDMKTLQKSNACSIRELQRLFKSYQEGDSKNRNVMAKIADLMKSCKVLTNEELIKRAAFYLDNPTEQCIKLSKKEAVLTADIKSKFKIVFIDEFQDIYPHLGAFLGRICGQKQLALFGDPNQNIYEFLGSNKKVIKQLESINTNLKTMFLHDNFRSTPEIMAAANDIIHHSDSYSNYDPVLKGPCGISPQIIRIPDPIDELEFIVEQISQLVCSSVKLSDIAILTRTNAHSESIAQYFRAYNIKFQKLTSHPDWLSDVRIQFLIDLLRLATIAHYEVNAGKEELEKKLKSDFSVVVTLSAMRGVSDQSIQRLYLDCRQKSMPFWMYLTHVPASRWPVNAACRQKIESFKVNLSKLIAGGALFDMNDHSQLFKHICCTANAFDSQVMQFKNKQELDTFKSHLEQMLLVMKYCACNKGSDSSLVEVFLESYYDKSGSNYPADFKMSKQDEINISTIHSSKGLEFPVVFLMGTPHTVLPIESKALYVGMTRARNLLYLINIRHPKINSRLKTSTPSLLLNQSFWKYFCIDLNRPTNVQRGLSLHKYSMLKNKYNFSSKNKRSYSTMCKKIISFVATRYKVH